VRKALESLPWVRKVEVDFSKQQAVVTAEAKKYDEKELLKALEKKGYKGKVVKNGVKN
jgi:copper chaperone CopZ